MGYIAGLYGCHYRNIGTQFDFQIAIQSHDQNLLLIVHMTSPPMALTSPLHAPCWHIHLAHPSCPCMQCLVLAMAPLSFYQACLYGSTSQPWHSCLCIWHLVLAMPVTPLHLLSYLIWCALLFCTYIPPLSCTTGIYRLLDIYLRLPRSQYLAAIC